MIAGQIEIQLLAGIARLQADMDRANRIVGDATNRMGRAAGLAAAALGAIAGALSVSAFAGMIKGAIDAMDNLKDLSVTSKIAVEDLAGLQLAATQSGSDLEGTAEAIGKLSANMGKNSEQFARLGVTSKDPLEAFKQLSDVFRSIEDPHLRAAFAADALGKSWKSAAPLLSEGSVRIGEMIQRGKDISSVTTDMTFKADDFNDKMAEMDAAVEGVKLKLASEMLPAMVEITKAISTAYEESGKLSAVWTSLGGLGSFIFTDEFSSATVKIKNLNKELDDLYASRNVVGGPGGMLLEKLFGSPAEFDARIASARGQIKYIEDEAARPAKDAADKAKDDAAAKIAADKAQEFLKLGEAAREKARLAREAAAKKSAQEYASAVKSATDFAGGLKIEASQIGLTADQIRMMSAARAAANAPTAELRKEIMSEALALSIASAAWEKKSDAEKSVLDADANDDAAVGAINDQTKALLVQIKTYGMLPEAITRAQIADLEASKQSIVLTEAGLAVIQRKIDALNGLAVAQAGAEGLGSGTSLQEARDLLDILTAVDSATKSAAAGMAASFGRVGSAIGGLTTALSGYAAQQQVIAAQMAAAKADPKNGPEKIAKLEIAAAHASAQAKMKSYGDMAGAAKGFFNENSKGYKVMEGAEKAYRAFEMAMALKSMAISLFATSTKATAVVAGQGVETGAVAAGEGARNLLKIPGVIMSFMSSMGPWGAAAAVVAIAAVLGSTASGGGGGPSAKERLASQGTGSILGDSSAKSASISRAIELSATNSNIELTHTAGMLRALLNIESSIGNLGGLLVRSGAVGGATAPDQYGSMSKLAVSLDVITGKLFGSFTAKITNAIFGGKVSTIDTGIMMQEGALGSLLESGVKASQFTDTKKDGGIFHSDKYSTTSKSLGDEANDQFTKIFANMAKGIGEAGRILGLGGDSFTARLNSFVVDLGKVTTKGLTGEQIQEQLEAVFSKAADDMARWSVAGLKEFQQAGEGAFETLARITSNYANLDSILESVGMKFGAVGIASLSAREGLIELAGGIDTLASQTASFATNFLSEAERMAPVAKYVAAEMAALGHAGVTTRDQFKSVVLGLDLTSVAGRDQYVALMALETAFAKVHAATVDLSKSQQQIADERADLQGKLDELTMTSAQLLNKQRMAMDISNRGLFDQIQAVNAMKAAQDASKASLGDVITRMKSFGEAARSLKDGLLTGSLSTLTPVQQEAELRRQYEATKAAAFGGDEKARSNFNSIATAYLTASQKINGGDSAYSAALAGVIKDADAIALWSDSQIDVAQASLTALESQVLALGQLNSTMTTVADSLLAGDYSGVGTNAMAPLTAEIIALRAEVAGLRADQAKQTGAVIQANAQGQANAASAIVTGTGSAINNMTWQQKNRGEVLE
jgi:hypothetical protein